MNNFIPATLIDGELYVECISCGKLFIKYNASADTCDMNTGPCACGAWHSANKGGHFCLNCKVTQRATV